MGHYYCDVCNNYYDSCTCARTAASRQKDYEYVVIIRKDANNPSNAGNKVYGPALKPNCESFIKGAASFSEGVTFETEWRPGAQNMKLSLVISYGSKLPDRKKILAELRSILRESIEDLKIDGSHVYGIDIS